MNLTLSGILDLVGKLDDSPVEDAPRERFRTFLKTNVKEIGQVRDYVTECLNSPDTQHHRALQDLVNYVGTFLEFEVHFGRYHGVQNEIGFDGHWKSPSGFHLVVETKTGETYPIETATLLGYVNELIDKGEIPDEDHALGLYVVGKLHPKVSQLEGSIVLHKQTQKLRIISVESLLALAELFNEYDITHQDILALVRPASPTIDPVVALMARLVAEKPQGTQPDGETQGQEPKPDSGLVRHGDEPAYWLAPVRSDEDQTAEECIQALVSQEKIYAFGEKTPGRQQIKPGDWMCFYATTKGVVAHAKVVSRPEYKPHPAVRHSETYPWVFRTDKASLYLNNPIVIDADLRAQLDAFEDKDLNKPWSWLVFTTRRLSKHDFHLLTRGAVGS